MTLTCSDLVVLLIAPFNTLRLVCLIYSSWCVCVFVSCFNRLAVKRMIHYHETVCECVSVYIMCLYVFT